MPASRPDPMKPNGVAAIPKRWLAMPSIAAMPPTMVPIVPIAPMPPTPKPPMPRPMPDVNSSSTAEATVMLEPPTFALTEGKPGAVSNKRDASLDVEDAPVAAGFVVAVPVLTDGAGPISEE